MGRWMRVGAVVLGTATIALAAAIYWLSAGLVRLDQSTSAAASPLCKLLRFLNDGSYQPVGARAPREADVRIVAATHRDLAAAVAEGSFREDPFYRLKGVVLRTPSLAERAKGARHGGLAFGFNSPTKNQSTSAASLGIRCGHHRDGRNIWKGSILASVF